MVDELDLVALVLSSRLPVYGAGGSGGAMRFEHGDERADVIHVMVRKADLERVLGELKRDPLEL